MGTRSRKLWSSKSVRSVAWVAAAATLGGLAWDQFAARRSVSVQNQVWIDRLPEDERDMVDRLIFLDVERNKIGVVGKGSVWRHFAELFRWKKKGDHMVVEFPQERVRSEFTARARSCKGDAPAPFELCLKLSDGRHSRTLYSMREWRIESDATVIPGPTPMAIPVTRPEASGDEDMPELDFGATVLAGPTR